MKVIAKLSDNELNTLREALDVLETVQEIMTTEEDELIDEYGTYYDVTDINKMCNWLNDFLKL